MEKIVIVSLCAFGIALGLVHSCATKVIPSKEIEIVTVIDSTKVFELRDSINMLQDSLMIYKNDTVAKSELFILRYKLERIKYYNKIAGNGNNVKFLRGWINRVIEE